MKQVTVTEIRQNISEILDSLPAEVAIEVTRYGKVVAVLVDFSYYSQLKDAEYDISGQRSVLF